VLSRPNHSLGFVPYFVLQQMNSSERDCKCDKSMRLVKNLLKLILEIMKASTNVGVLINADVWSTTSL
jgi:hypothetical protein